jgi:uncharacterized protein YqjF (DUF2071 family)
MDRLTPTQRPDQVCLARQTWRNLLFLHWAVPRREVRRLLPPGLQPDLYRGVAYVGVALLDADHARPGFVPVRVGMRFVQVTVRTYVHSGGENPGIYLLSLDSTSRLVTGFARTLLNVPCFSATMERQARGRDVEFRMHRGGTAPAHLAVRYAPARRLGEMRPGSLGFFLLERYILYFESAGLLFRTHVHHPPYQARNARLRELDEDVAAAAGVAAPAHLPHHAYHVDAVDLEVFPPEMVERKVPVAQAEGARWEPAPRLEVVGGCGTP